MAYIITKSKRLVHLTTSVSHIKVGWKSTKTDVNAFGHQEYSLVFRHRQVA